MVCSNEVNGPDSTTSVDSAPVKETNTNSQMAPDRANTKPTTPRATYNPAYHRRRPQRSAQRATATDASTVPATTAARTPPIATEDSPRWARVVPTKTAPNP